MPNFKLSLAICLLLAFKAEASCSSGYPSWKSASQGPKVTQPSTSDPTKIMINWAGMIKKPECIDEIYVHVWRKEVDGPLTGARQFGPLPKTTTSHIVSNFNPCVDYYIQVEYLEKSRWSGPPVKVKSGKTLFKTTATPVLQTADSVNFCH